MNIYFWFLLIQNTFTPFPVLALKCYISDYESCLKTYQDKIDVGSVGSVTPPLFMLENDRKNCYNCLQNVKPKIMLCERECLCTTIIIQTSGMIGTETPTIKLLDYNNRTCADWEKRKYASTCIKNWYSTKCETCTEDLCNKNTLTDGVTEEVTQEPPYNLQLKCYKNDWKSCYLSKDHDKLLKCLRDSRVHEEKCEKCAKATFSPIGEDSFTIADCSHRNDFCKSLEKKRYYYDMTNCQTCGSKLCNKQEKKSNKASKATSFGIFIHLMFHFFIIVLKDC